MQNDKPFRSVLDDIENKSDKSDTNLKSLIEAFGAKSFGPVLTLIGLLALSPFGAIPGVPVGLAIVTILIAGQIILGRDHLWLPDFINSMKLKAGTINKADKKIGRIPDFLDSLLQPRLKWAVGNTAVKLAAAFCILLSLLMIPLEIVPFAVAIPAAGLVLIGLALVASDGVFMLGGFFVGIMSLLSVSLLIF
ncbi:exopolysaccharide biosynthesis protein [Hirschia baltica]|uniref:Exopolysaccharide synthesis ExoD n=1 Tax=Hirschia baltica (strain ATCC 49814 / DSM 5838 / IFAM 1418) TaxID=582402 RepID=C6XLB5_HIRBI|nr:exopolysaccharide biosynthesis protein [Hirschia baltica]ACT59714.1 Exopolysaccharide synthesis ExoD [Hirschia baltica ATCC 49814]